MNSAWIQQLSGSIKHKNQYHNEKNRKNKMNKYVQSESTIAIHKRKDTKSEKFNLHC